MAGSGMRWVRRPASNSGASGTAVRRAVPAPVARLTRAAYLIRLPTARPLRNGGDRLALALLGGHGLKFVTAADHWLPPDNYQEDPKGEITHRTSPTNRVYICCRSSRLTTWVI